MATKGSEQGVASRVRGVSSDALAVIAQRAQASTHASGAAIALSEGNADEITCRARAGSSAPEVGTALPVQKTFTGLCIQSGKELRCDDAETDPRVDKAAVSALGIRSMVAVPIKGEGRVVGVLVVFAPTAHAFKVHHVLVLKTLADQIAASLYRNQRDEAYSREPLAAPPVKAIAPSTAASPAPPPAIKRAEPALRRREAPLVPKVEPVRASTAEEIDPAPFSKKKQNSYGEQKESKTDSQRLFGTLDEAAAPENRLGTKVGAAAVVVIAVVLGLSYKLRRPAAAPQPAPAPASASLQRPTMDTPAAPAAKHDEAQPKREQAQPKREEAQPKREEIIALSASPSRISISLPANGARVEDPALPAGARDNLGPTSVAPAISLNDVPASGSLSNLASPVSQPPRPRLLTQSELEPVTAIVKVRPVYPLVAKQYKLSGSVVVQGTVNKNGRLTDLQLISGSPLFRDAAFAALKRWVFKPARLNGQAIEQPTTIRLDFGAR